MDRWAIGRLSHGWFRYAVALGVVFLAWAVTALTWDWIRPVVALFFAAVMVAAWNGGFGPGLLASVLAAVLSEALLSDSLQASAGLRGAVRFSVFLLSALLINWLNVERRRAHAGLERRVDERTAELRTAVDTLRREVHDREQAEREVRAQGRRLRELAAELSLAEERQLRRVATELHDGIGQLLFTAEIRLDLLEDRLASSGVIAAADVKGVEVGAAVEEIRNLIGESIQRTRSLTVELSPPVLYEAGFDAAIRWLATQVRQRHGLDIAVESDGTAEPSTEDTRVFLFQAVRELLTNMAKHSGARTGRIRIGRDDASLRITVEDDGAGFEPATVLGTSGTGAGEGAGDGNGTDAPNAKHSFGLFNIRERLRHLGGRLEVDAAPGRGARFVVVVPTAETVLAGSGGRAAELDHKEGRTP